MTTPEDMVRFNEVMSHVRKLIEDRDDRVAGIIAGAFIEELLEQLLRSFMVEKTPDELWSFNGPLGTFANKAAIAYSLGLLEDEAFVNIRAIRDIRNKCAHLIGLDSGFVVDLTKSPLSDHLKETIPGRWRERLPRDQVAVFDQLRHDISAPEKARDYFELIVSITAMMIVATRTSLPSRCVVPPDRHVGAGAGWAMEGQGRKRRKGKLK